MMSFLTLSYYNILRQIQKGDNVVNDEPDQFLITLEY